MLLACALAIVGNSSVAEETSAKGVPQIEVRAREFYVTTQSDSPPITHRFPFHNAGDSDLHLLRVDASCGCLYELPENRTVPPGAESWLDIRYDLRGKDFGSYSEKVVLVTDDLTEPEK